MVIQEQTGRNRPEFLPLRTSEHSTAGLGAEASIIQLRVALLLHPYLSVVTRAGADLACVVHPIADL